jgi:CheY-like chemotaxis protein
MPGNTIGSDVALTNTKCPLSVAEWEMAVVLVAEDERSVRESVLEALADAGHTALDAADGEKAISILREHPEIELLFTDIHMPGAVDGIELAKIARRMRRDLKVLYATSHVQELLRDRGPIDPDQVVRKPYLPGQVVAAVAWALRRAD